MDFDILPRSFYAADTVDIAQLLLGKLLIHHSPAGLLSARIVETEAYVAVGDEASHAYRGITPRNSVMFGEPGHAYVYFSYGMHYLLNAVTEAPGVAGAVLIRAAEPVSGVAAMAANRKNAKHTLLCSGPARLTSAFGIDTSLDRVDLVEGGLLTIGDDGFRRTHIVSGPRIGITRSIDFPWRYYIRGNPHVSRP